MSRTLLSILVCAVVASSVAAHRDVSPSEVERMIREGEDPIILDVREYSEFCAELQHVDDAVSLPWITGVLEARYAELPTNRKIVAVCASGGRSHLAASFLDSRGFSDVYDMLGGMSAWTAETEPCSAEPVLELSRGSGSVRIDWTPTHGTQDYDLIRGFLEDVTSTGAFVDLGPGECLRNESPFSFHEDSDATLPELYFYLSRQDGEGWGESSQQQPRIPVPAACE